MKLSVDPRQRFAKMRAHTAAHLIHAELAKIFPATKQAWSFVDEDYVRFDFVADRLLSQEEVVALEKAVNDLIYQGYGVEVIETSYDEAIKLWAKAFFEDKYGDVVRVVKVDNNISTELCGWTHAHNTRDLGAFAIIAQETVASWIKRITAVTGTKVYNYLLEKDSLLNDLAAKFDVNSKQLLDKVDKFVKDFADMKKTLESLETKVAHQVLESAVSQKKEGFDKYIQVSNDINFKLISLAAKTVFADQTVLVFNQEGSFVLLDPKWKAKTLASWLGIKWWGTDSLVQWRDISLLK